MSKKKKEETESHQLAKKTNSLRGKAIKHYLHPSEVTEQDLELGYQEIQSHPDGVDNLYAYTYKSIYELGKPASKVISCLMKEKQLTNIAAQYLVKNLTKEISGSMNAIQEFHQNMNLTNHCISELMALIEQVGNDGAESSIDISSLFAEARQWLALKNTIINQAHVNHIQEKAVDIEAQKVNALSELTLEDLLKLKDEL